MAKKFNLAEYVKAEGVSDSDPARIVEIPLSKIIANNRNFYGVRDVEALADSIKLNGLLEPLIVYPYGTAAGLYRLISGHRRVAALQLNKAEAAPCRIVDKPASAAREDLMLISANGQRTKTGAEVAA
ncbi:MAG: ParB N-terminal domain-containing protein, partial [Firmicutes bacterium]|nr:ParB N-terminal domain-containing protein [Bacillota bacterium]